MNQRIVFATTNEGKMSEIREILSDCGYDILSMKEAAKQLPEDIVMADDSGLEIDYLNKEPGIYSARYLGEDTSYDIKNRALLDRMAGVEKEQRTARFVSAIAAAVPGKGIFTVRGTVEGYIGWEPAGTNGFGYDPIFYVDEYGCSTAELTMEQKNAFSHRGNALRAMKELLIEKGVLRNCV